MADVKKRKIILLLTKMLHLLLKRASDMVRVKENQGILLWYRRTSNDIDIGQREPTIWKLIFPGQI